MDKKVTAVTLRSRPEEIRYAYIAVGKDDLHIGMSHAGLVRAMKADEILNLIVIDTSKGINFPADAHKFADWWRKNYSDPFAEYMRG